MSARSSAQLSISPVVSPSSTSRNSVTITTSSSRRQVRSNANTNVLPRSQENILTLTHETSQLPTAVASTSPTVSRNRSRGPVSSSTNNAAGTTGSNTDNNVPQPARSIMTRKRTRAQAASVPPPSTSASTESASCSVRPKKRTRRPNLPAGAEAMSATTPEVPQPPKFHPNKITIGTYCCDPASYISINPEGISLCVQIDKDVNKSVGLPLTSFVEYLVCDSAQLPVMILRGNSLFAEKIRSAIQVLRSSDFTDLSSPVFDPYSSDRSHWYVIIELKSASDICDLVGKLMRCNVTASPSGAIDKFVVPKSVVAEEAKKKINATQTIILKCKELQLGTWKSKPCSDCTVHISGSRIKFRANNGGNNDITLAIHLSEVSSILFCIAQNCPVMFVRASESFGWSARDRLGISATFQHGKDYYNPDSAEVRFKYVTLKLDKQGLSRELWQKLCDISGDRIYTLDLINSRVASDILRKLVYQPMTCKGVRVGANELDEIRAVTIHFDNLCICGCMLDSVVTMTLCIADIKEISMCMSDKLPVIFVKTSTSISDTLKKNMSSRSTEVYFDPSSKDIRTQYIVLELTERTDKDMLKKICTTLQSILSNFNDRTNVPKDQRANLVQILSKKKAEDFLKAIKQPLKAKDCTCGKKVDLKRKEEVRSYVQSMVQKHGCDALEKIASRVVDLERKIMCSVCLDKDCQVVFSCGHMICEKCDRSLRKCHICRMKILRRVKVFI